MDTKKESPPQSPPREHPHAGRIRRPALVAVTVEIVLYATLPSAVIVGPRLVIPILGIALLVPLAIVSRRSVPGRALTFHRTAAIALILLIAVVNTVSLLLLVRKIVTGEAFDGGSLLLAALQIWLTNVISFALIFWELDRGGPTSRALLPRSQLRRADFRFAQDEDHGAVREVAIGSSDKSDWRPGFVDYLYVSLTNSSAFSPTDTMPLSSRTKILMGIESSEALILSLLVVAQAVSLIGS